MNRNLLIILTCLLVYPLPVLAHNYAGMVGFYDGISHPVLGLDHFLAMISVGILSSQIGGKAIWTVPATFVFVMTIGGLVGFLLTIDDHFFIEVGIILSVMIYFLVNAAYVVGFAPTTGLPMPFISYGGSHTIFTLISMGLLLNIARKSRTGTHTYYRGFSYEY